MNPILHFGIPSLDRLLGRRGEGSNSESRLFGLYIDKHEKTGRYASTSFCIVGPDGAGKSVLALHLASRYAAQTFHSDSPRDVPAVLYASTDLNYHKALAVWKNFGLNWPVERDKALYKTIPEDRYAAGLYAEEIFLTQYRPFLDPHSKSAASAAQGQPGALLDYIKPRKLGIDSPPKEVAFIDLESNTAGDDWGFLTRLLAALDVQKVGRSGAPMPLHMIVIDAVEGLQMMGGERDAFGEQRSRRSHIAQLIRAASGKCHLVFVVEEPKSEERFPEQFVTDAVLRLRAVPTMAGSAPNSPDMARYAHRTFEIEKARAQTHVRGQHAFTIRGGNGSTTGKQVNPDDLPYTIKQEGKDVPLSYVRVFHSLDYRSRQQMERHADDLHVDPIVGNHAFGITYLDNMLAPPDALGVQGLPYRTVTAIVGSNQTHKSRLGRAFLSGCFKGLKDRLDKDQLSSVPSEIYKDYMRVCQYGSDGDHLAWSNRAQKASTLWCHKEELAEIKKLVEAKQKAADRLTKAQTTGRGLDRATEALEKARKDLQLERQRIQSRLPGVAILITTEDIQSHNLARTMFEWLYKRKFDEQNAEDVRFMAFAESRTICRRLEIHSITPAVLFSVIRRCVEKAQDILLPPRAGFSLEESQKRRRREGLTDDEFNRCAQIRIVIDNWNTIVNTYPAIREDALFLPYLLFYLRRQGVTTIIAESQAAGDALPSTYVSTSRLAHFVDLTLLTWNVRFQGRRLVAISPLTAFSPGKRSLTREVVHSEEAIRDGLDTVYVDPHLELYSHLSTGEPVPIPLRVRLFTEHEMGARYAERTNILLGDIFPTANDRNRPVVSYTPMPFEENGETRYERLREISYLHDDFLNETVVWQMDEFWVMDAQRGTASQKDYLNAVTFSGVSKAFEIENRIADPYNLFGPTADTNFEASRLPRRIDNFHIEELGYADMTTPGREPDRIPYTWDFGFLMCRSSAWQRAFERQFRVSGMSGDPYTIKEIWTTLTDTKSSRVRANGREPWSWRAFLQACTIVAQVDTRRSSEPSPAFDLSLLTPESVSCLLLEIWMSEIYRIKRREAPASAGAFLNAIGYERTLTAGDYSLQRLSREFPLELYKSIMLLFEMLEPLGVVDKTRVFSYSIRDANPHSVAVRHWYKTAAKAAQKHDALNPIVPVRLPGHFSMRGDWFLAIAAGSRSIRLGERAMDLLSSRRANIVRLQEGLGLPTRKLMNEAGYDALRTCLFTDNSDYETNTRWKTEQDSLTEEVYPATYRRSLLYKDLCAMGASRQNEQENCPFYWLWRSRIRHYDRHTRPFQKWLCRLLLEIEDLRRSRGPDWRSGFDVYDLLDESGEEAVINRYDSYRLFTSLLQLLHAELQAAAPYSPEAR